jgi:hypothetical protein
MMQCVTCNKSFLFTSRLKALEYQKKKDNYYYGTKKSFQMFLKWKRPIHSYMKLRHEQYWNTIWIELNCNLINFKFSEQLD